MTEITKLAEECLERHLKRRIEPTQKIAVFRTMRGREIALQREREAIFIWTEQLGEYPPEITPKKRYPKEKSRSSALNRKNSPRLMVGNAVEYWEFERLAQLESLILWYQQQ